MRQGDWNVHPFGCDGVTIRNVTIFSPRWRGNTDGLDPDFCINVLVEDSVITSGDDAIAVKAGSGTPGGAASNRINPSQIATANTSGAQGIIEDVSVVFFLKKRGTVLLSSCFPDPSLKPCSRRQR